jgi:hypothetical protein
MNNVAGYQGDRQEKFSLNALPETKQVGRLTDLSEILESCRIDPSSSIAAPEPILLYENGFDSEIPILTKGNFSLVVGKAKSRKTFLISSIIASVLSGEVTLGVLKGSLPPGERNVLHFDTEQGKWHALMTVRRTCRMGGAESNRILGAYSLRQMTPTERLEIIEYAIYHTPDLAFVVIDGLRDLLNYGINNEEEATFVIHKLMKWSADLNIHIMAVLHMNKNDQNARGHIGTEAVNKAETVITVSMPKDNPDISVVECEFSRGRPFNKFAFTIEDDLVVGTDVAIMGSTKKEGGCIIEGQKPAGRKPALTPDSLPIDTHRKVLDGVFEAKHAFTYTELWRALKVRFVKEGYNLGDNKAKDFLTYYQLEGLVGLFDRRYIPGNKLV